MSCLGLSAETCSPAVPATIVTANRQRRFTREIIVVDLDRVLHVSVNSKAGVAADRPDASGLDWRPAMLLRARSNGGRSKLPS